MARENSKHCQAIIKLTSKGTLFKNYEFGFVEAIKGFKRNGYTVKPVYSTLLRDHLSLVSIFFKDYPPKHCANESV